MQMRRTSVLPVAAGLAAVVAFSAACSASTLDIGKLEQSITDKITAVDVPVKSVECPENREVKAGDAFECTAITGNDVRVSIAVTQKDDTGNIGFEVGKQVFSSEKVVPVIEQNFSDNGRSVIAVACPKGVAVADGNGVLDCTAKADDIDYLISIPIRDGVAQLNDWTLTESAAATTPGSPVENPAGGSAETPSEAPTETPVETP